MCFMVHKVFSYLFFKNILEDNCFITSIFSIEVHDMKYLPNTYNTYANQNGDQSARCYLHAFYMLSIRNLKVSFLLLLWISILIFIYLSFCYIL